MADSNDINRWAMEISEAIGHLRAKQDAHEQTVRDLNIAIVKRLDVIEGKIDPLVAYRNRMYGGAAAIATGASMIAPWIAKKLGLT